MTRISFYGSDKVTMNVTSEQMGVKQGEQISLRTHFSERL